ncbi:hypothetical protein AAFF_G00125160 [Aldrovandia affinis]|uniref:Uncharacterized protein n=1 Tax=Aldrovandia affinis TaxID=143900 RepID=A0AAD7RRP3_9TELE|nr:hypothetical protein AAFF_G00125160 [Aldrovandia affinis]
MLARWPGDRPGTGGRDLQAPVTRPLPLIPYRHSEVCSELAERSHSRTPPHSYSSLCECCSVNTSLNAASFSKATP